MKRISNHFALPVLEYPVSIFLEKPRIGYMCLLLTTLQSLEPLESNLNEIPSSLTSESLSEVDIVGLRKKAKDNVKK